MLGSDTTLLAKKLHYYPPLNHPHSCFPLPPFLVDTFIFVISLHSPSFLRSTTIWMWPCRPLQTF